MWHTLRINEVERKLKTDLRRGLTTEEANRRQEKYGENKLKDNKVYKTI